MDKKLIAIAAAIVVLVAVVLGLNAIDGEETKKGTYKPEVQTEEQISVELQWSKVYINDMCTTVKNGITFWVGEKYDPVSDTLVVDYYVAIDADGNIKCPNLEKGPDFTSTRRLK